MQHLSVRRAVRVLALALLTVGVVAGVSAAGRSPRAQSDVIEACRHARRGAPGPRARAPPPPARAAGPPPRDRACGRDRACWPRRPGRSRRRAGAGR